MNTFTYIIINTLKCYTQRINNKGLIQCQQGPNKFSLRKNSLNFLFNYLGVWLYIAQPQKILP